VPIPRPPLLTLGGEDQFAAYQAEFDRLYHDPANPVAAIRDPSVEFVPVEFAPDACRHVCYEGPEGDPYGKRPRIWSQKRAERIGWILLALTDPATEVRPDFQDPRRISYTLIIEADPAQGLPREFYGVITRLLPGNREEFVTGFAFDFAYWRKLRNGGAPLYPLRPRKAKTRKKR
jgi:hypothetical protein